MSRDSKPVIPLTEGQKALAESCYRLGWRLALAYYEKHPDRDFNDLLSDALLATCHAAATFRSDHLSKAKFATFCHRVITRALCHKTWRARRREALRPPHASLEAWFRSGGDIPSRPETAPCQTLETAKRDQTVHAALDALDPQLRNALVLRYFLDETLEEIGETLTTTRGPKRLGVTKEAARLVIMRAKRAMAVNIQEALETK